MGKRRESGWGFDWRSWTFGVAVDSTGWVWFHFGPVIAYTERVA